MEIVIIGGDCWIEFGKRIIESKDIHVTLVDKNNYNFFRPYLSSCNCFLEPFISYPFRKIAGKKNLQFRLDSSRLLSRRKQSHSAQW
jgi:NADH dehydrogenase